MAGYTPYLTEHDYIATIQKGHFSSQLLDASQDGLNQRIYVESWALERIRNKIGDTYDLDFEFRPTLPYSASKKYHAGDRVVIDFDEWTSNTHYINHSSCVVKDGYGYICLQDNTDSVFDSTKWQILGHRHDIYHIKYPSQIFSVEVGERNGIYVKGFYKSGDIVWWNNHTYQNNIPTTIISHESLIQLQSYSGAGLPNVFPNDPEAGSLHWKDLGEYFISAGKYPYVSTDGYEESVWTFGDNRNPVFVQCVIDLALFRLFQRISPNNIPDNRYEAFRYSMQWLSDLQSDKEQTDIPRLQPSQGGGISWGSKPKKQNGW